MASDKNHVEVMREVRRAEPAFVFCAETLVSGGTERAAPATALRDAFVAAAKTANTARRSEPLQRRDEKKTAEEDPAAEKTTSPSPRAVVIPDLERAMAEAVDAVRERGGGVVCVTGSLNVVARAEAWANRSGG